MELLRETSEQTIVEQAHPLVSDWKPRLSTSMLQRLRERANPRAVFTFNWYVGWMIALGLAGLVRNHTAANLVGFINIGNVIVFLIPRRSRRGLGKTESFLDDVKEPHSCVEVEYTWENAHLGRDCGVLFVADGWLNFEGQRTRFSLKPSDVVGKRGPGGQDWPAFTLKGAEHPFSIAFYNVPGVKGLAVRDVQMFCEKWWHTAANVVGRSVLPPTVPEDGYLGDLKLYQSLCAAGVIVAVMWSTWTMLRLKPLMLDDDASICYLLLAFGIGLGLVSLAGAFSFGRNRAKLLRFLRSDQSINKSSAFQSRIAP